MHQHSVTVVADGIPESEALERIVTPILSAWPAGTPRSRTLSMGALLHETQTRAAHEIGAALAPLLIVLDATHHGSRLCRLVDTLQSAALPAVLLLPNADAATRRLQSGGVIIETHAADPRTIAAYLYALAERQTTIVEVVRELAIHTRYEGGMRGEIDRIHDELNLAATVQREMLPRSLPAFAGLEFATLFRPAGYVSGDIYDIVQLDEEHIGFFIADAVGHGVPAALMTMVISRSLKMVRMSELTLEQSIVPPGEAMSRLNDELCRTQRDNAPRFSTAVYGVMNTRTREVRLVGAGHPPPLRIRGGTPQAAGTRGAARAPGTLDRVPTDGPLLGIFPGEAFLETSFTLEPGETLLLYSDGFETAFAPPDPAAPASAHRRRAAEQYLDELAALPWPDAQSGLGSPAGALSELAQRIDEQSGSLHQIDDVTALAISVCEPAQSDEPAREGESLRQAA